ncbi:hypothetical protein ACFLXP_04790 [Chloroflexota bacterium]
MITSTFVIQATPDHFLSKFFIKWAVVWSTFIGSLLAIFILAVAFDTYWNERRTKKIEMEDTLSRFAANVITTNNPTFFLKIGDEELSEDEKRRLAKKVSMFSGKIMDTRVTAKKYGGTMAEKAEELFENIADLELLLATNEQVKRAEASRLVDTISSLALEIIRYED